MVAHIHGKIDFTAEVFVVYKDTVLLKRHRKFNSIWLSVGGHIELDEDPTEAAVREVKEEVGLNVVLYDGDQRFRSVEDDYRDLIPPIALGCHQVNDTHRHLVLVYFATTDSDNVIPERPDDEWIWVTKEKLATMDLRPNVRYYAEAALEKLGRAS